MQLSARVLAEAAAIALAEAKAKHSAAPTKLTAFNVKAAELVLAAFKDCEADEK
jgi:hypothetical protein